MDDDFDDDGLLPFPEDVKPLGYAIATLLAIFLALAIVSVLS